jgi:hypothetical protein
MIANISFIDGPNPKFLLSIPFVNFDTFEFLVFATWVIEYI